MPGPNPTFAEKWTEFGKFVKIVNETEKFGGSNAANYLDMEDALTTGLDGVFTPPAVEELRRDLRGPLANFLAPSTLRKHFHRFLQDLAKIVAAPELERGGSITDARALRRIREYMVTNSQTLNSRGMTIDTTATSSGTGTGSVHRLTVDKDNNTLECTGAETKTLYCVADQNTLNGEKHGEVFEFRFATAQPDGLYWAGTGGKKRIASLHCKSAQILQNPSFEQGASTDDAVLSSTTQLTGWTAGTAASVKTRSASGYTYRGFPGDQNTTLWGVEFVGSTTLTQVLRTASPGARFDERKPYYCQIAWKRLASATGTLTLHLGSRSVSVDVSTGVNGAWNILRLPVGQNNWFTRFNEADLDVKVDMASLATGTVVVDDLVLAPYENVDGTWWAIVGSDTPWLFGDTHTFTDVDGGTRAIFSYWLWRAYHDQADVMLELRGWLPTDNAGLETIADPI